MSFLGLNGLPFPVAVESLSHRLEEVGESRRAIDGTLVTDRRAVKSVYEFATPPRPVLEALYLRDVLAGVADVWAFSNSHPYSSKGRIASTGSTTYTGTGKWGGSALVLSAVQSVIFPAVSASGSTVFMWQTQNSGTTWYLEVASFDADGLLVDTWRVTTAGVVTVTSPIEASWTDDREFNPGATTWVSDVWVVGHAPTGIADATFVSSWLPALGQVTRARAAAPHLVLSGDVVSQALTVRGEAGGGGLLPVWRDGVFSLTEHTLQATLTEV